MGNIIKYTLRANFKGNFARDTEKINFYARWLEDELLLKPEDDNCDVEDSCEYLPTEEYAREDKDLVRKLFVSGRNQEPPNWVDQEYIKSLIEKEQTTDRAAYELAKTLNEKHKNGDWENGR